ncbi:ABC transporter permease [Actinopolymorpha pittospori]|uniref:ABC transporter permease n=1 Tax=Actinopolymorpha pittospori TaxID=648752 RepID=UPI003B58AB6D
MRAQFLTEAVALSTLGGLGGIVVGVPVVLGYATLQGWPPVVPVSAMALGIVGAVVVGMLAGLHPSIRASRLTPTEALAST